MNTLNTDEKDSPPPRELLESLFRHKKKATFFFAIVVIAAWTVLALTPSEYTSTAKLIVRRSRDNSFYDPMTPGGDIRPVYKEWKTEINSELEILSSRELLKNLVNQFGPEAFLAASEPSFLGEPTLIRAALDPHRDALKESIERLKKQNAPINPEPSESPEDKAIRKMEKNLEISIRDNSDIIIISYTAPRPELAENIVTQLITLYLENRIDVLRTPGAYQFFIQQSEKLLEELTQTEDSLLAIKSAAGISSLEDNRRTLLSTIESVRAQRLNTQSALTAVEARLVILRAMLSSPGELDSQVQDENSIKELLLILDQKLSSRRSGSLRPTIPDNTGNKGDILLDPDEYKALLASLHEEVSARSALIAEEQKTFDQLTQLRAELNQIDQLEAPIRRLDYEKELLEGKYRIYLENKEQARVNQELESKQISNISIVQHATLPSRPDPSGKLVKLLAAMFLGLMGSIAVAFGANYADPMVYSEFDLTQRLGLKTLIELPRFNERELDSSKPAPWIETRLGYSRKMSCKTVEHYFQDLCLKLLAWQPSAQAPFFIGITSSSAGEGVSTIASQLFDAFVQDGRFTDIQLMNAHPEIHPEIRSELFLKQLPDASCTPLQLKEAVDVSDPSPGKTLTATTLIEYLFTLRKKEHGLIIVDLPPMEDVGYTARTAANMDIVVLVVDSGRIPWRTVQWSKELLLNANAKLGGVILNRKRIATPTWLYQKL